MPYAEVKPSNVLLPQVRPWGPKPQHLPPEVAVLIFISVEEPELSEPPHPTKPREVSVSPPKDRQSSFCTNGAELHFVLIKIVEAGLGTAAGRKSAHAMKLCSEVAEIIRSRVPTEAENLLDLATFGTTWRCDNMFKANAQEVANIREKIPKMQKMLSLDLTTDNSSVLQREPQDGTTPEGVFEIDKVIFQCTESKRSRTHSSPATAENVVDKVRGKIVSKKETSEKKFEAYESDRKKREKAKEDRSTVANLRADKNSAALESLTSSAQAVSGSAARPDRASLQLKI